MKIYKMITDGKPTHCIACPLARLNICGKDNNVRGTSGSMYIERIPDCRCKLRIKEK